MSEKATVRRFFKDVDKNSDQNIDVIFFINDMIAEHLIKNLYKVNITNCRLNFDNEESLKDSDKKIELSTIRIEDKKISLAKDEMDKEPKYYLDEETENLVDFILDLPIIYVDREGNPYNKEKIRANVKNKMVYETDKESEKRLSDVYKIITREIDDFNKNAKYIYDSDSLQVLIEYMFLSIRISIDSYFKNKSEQIIKDRYKVLEDKIKTFTILTTIGKLISLYDQLDDDNLMKEDVSKGIKDAESINNIIIKTLKESASVNTVFQILDENVNNYIKALNAYIKLEKMKAFTSDEEYKSAFDPIKSNINSINNRLNQVLTDLVNGQLKELEKINKKVKTQLDEGLKFEEL